MGFAAINGTTFALDLLVVTLLHGLWRAPYPLAVGVGYAIAFGLGFALNRVLNFRSHAPVGRQTVVYLGVVAVNSAILVGASSALEAGGVQYQVARVAAGACEGISMCCALRWVVFRGAPAARADRARRPPAAGPGERVGPRC